ncbi:MAG: 30S ribosomal protein S12 methylthiotransferase RimO [Bdellovibrionota bacterium]
MIKNSQEQESNTSTQKNAQKRKVHFISLGCPKNLVDSEMMIGSLTQSDYVITDSAEDAETIIVNTCGFIEDAKKESLSTIFEMSRMKEDGKLKQLVVAGCLTQRYKEDLVNDLPEADVFVGSGEFQNIVKILDENRLDATKKRFFNLPTYLQQENTPRVNSQMPHRAYLKISEGCLKRCAFCAIPKIRGNLQSRTIENVVNEAKLLVAGGVKELNVISHDFTDYGWDLRRKDPENMTSPVELLRRLSDIKGLDWVRVLYLYPDGITPEMVKLVKEKNNLVKYFDMPLQHINNEMLKRMNRKMTREEIQQAITNIRTEIPDAVIRTQFIVGFPGETEEYFQELLDFVKEQKFDRVGCFKYSPEESTAGGKMTDQIDEDIKEDRFHRLMSLQLPISKKKHKSMIGSVIDVIVEGVSEESELLLKGRSSQQAPDIDGIVYINEGDAKIGDLVKVEITDAMEYDLIGKIISEN